MMSVLKLSIRLTFTIFIFFYILKIIDINDTFKNLFKINIFIYIISVSLLFIISMNVLTLKWKYILEKFGIRANFFKLLKLNYFSVFISVIGLGYLVGETFKAFKVIKGVGSKTPYIASIILDRLTGFLTLGMLSSSYLIFSKTVKYNFLLFTIIIFSISIFGVLFLLFSREILYFINKNIFAGKIENLKFLNITLSYKLFNKKIPTSFKLLVLAYSVIYHFSLIVSLWLISKSININLSLFQFAWVYALSSMVLLLPITIAGIGVREGSFIVLLGSVGVNAEKAVSLSIYFFFSQLLLGALGGFLEFKDLIFNSQINFKDHLKFLYSTKK